MRRTTTDYDRMPLALVLLLAAFLIAGLAGTKFAAPEGEAIPTLPDLSNAQFVEIRDARGRTVLSGEFRERVDELGNMDRDATLMERGGRHVIGKIEVAVPSPHTMTAMQELDVDMIDLQPNAKYAVFIDDREVATLTSDDRGSIDVKLHGTAPAHDAAR